VKGPQLELVMLMFESYGERYGSSVFDDLYEVFYSLIKVKSINQSINQSMVQKVVGVLLQDCAGTARVSAVSGVTLLE
jgi:hypothetical protein